MSEHTCIIRGETAEDDGLEIDMGPTHGDWATVPLPRCPDCGGDLIWWEAGYVPGTRRCVGAPVGGRPANPMLDARVPLPDGCEYRGRPNVRLPADVADQARALFARRNTCTDQEVYAIDEQILALLRPWIRLEYAQAGGCGSMFSVQSHAGQCSLRRERFYAGR